MKRTSPAINVHDQASNLRKPSEVPATAIKTKSKPTRMSLLPQFLLALNSPTATSQRVSLYNECSS